MLEFRKYGAFTGGLAQIHGDFSVQQILTQTCIDAKTEISLRLVFNLHRLGAMGDLQKMAELFWFGCEFAVGCVLFAYLLENAMMIDCITQRGPDAKKGVSGASFGGFCNSIKSGLRVQKRV